MLTTTPSLARVTPDSVRKFRATFFTPNRMVVAGVGIDHDKLCELAAKHFDLPVPSPGTLEAQADADRDLATSRYKGGVASSRW